MDPLFFLLCDDLPDGELEPALTLLHPIPPERRRVLAVLADHSDRQRLQSLQEAGVDGLCTLGSIGEGRIYTAMDVIASGGTDLDPLFRQRLLELAGDGPMRCVHDLKALEGRLLRDACRGHNSLEIAERQGLGSHRGLNPHRRMNRQQHPLPCAREGAADRIHHHRAPRRQLGRIDRQRTGLFASAQPEGDMAHHLGHRYTQQRLIAGLQRQLGGAALHRQQLEAARPIPFRHHQGMEAKAGGCHRCLQHLLHLLAMQGMTLLEIGGLGSISRRARSGCTTTRIQPR